MPSFFNGAERPGNICNYGGGAIPSNYLLCDGASLLINDFPALFTAIGYRFGGAGANFNLPNSSRKDTFGFNPATAGPRPIGAIFGEEQVILEEQHIRYHQHTNSSVGTWTHAHNHGGGITDIQAQDHTHRIGVEGPNDHGTFAFDCGVVTGTNVTHSSAWPYSSVDEDGGHGVPFTPHNHIHGVNNGAIYSTLNPPTYQDIAVPHYHPVSLGAGSPSDGHNNWHPIVVVTKMIRF